MALVWGKTVIKDLKSIPYAMLRPNIRANQLQSIKYVAWHNYWEVLLVG